MTMTVSHRERHYKLFGCTKAVVQAVTQLMNKRATDITFATASMSTLSDK